jgi:hypothetical protein
MLHWGPFSLKAGTRVLWSSEDENLYGDIINLPCAGVGILDAVVILDTSSNLNNSPRTDEADEREIATSGKGWNPSGIGRLLSPQPHHRTKSPSNGEYRMTSSQSDAQRVTVLPPLSPLSLSLSTSLLFCLFSLLAYLHSEGQLYLQVRFLFPRSPSCCHPLRSLCQGPVLLFLRFHRG